MRAALQLVLYLIGLPLEVMVIAAMARSRAWRTFPLVFAYAVALLAASLVEVPVYATFFIRGARRGHTRAFFYWLNEAVLQVLMFAAVISLIYLATEALENRTLIRRVLVAGAVLFAPLSLAIHYDPGVAFRQVGDAGQPRPEPGLRDSRSGAVDDPAGIPAGGPPAAAGVRGIGDSIHGRSDRAFPAAVVPLHDAIGKRVCGAGQPRLPVRMVADVSKAGEGKHCGPRGCAARCLKFREVIWPQQWGRSTVRC